MVNVKSHTFEDERLHVTVEFEGETYDLVFDYTVLDNPPNQQEKNQGEKRIYSWLAEPPKNLDLISSVVEVNVGLYLSNQGFCPLTKPPSEYEPGEPLRFDIKESLNYISPDN